MNVETKLTCGHDFRLALPDDVFSRGVLVVPCPECGKKYRLDHCGKMEPYESKPFKFLAMHY